MRRLLLYALSRFLCLSALAFLASLTPTIVGLAQGNSVVTPSTLANAWPWDPLTLIGIAASWLIYDRGIRRLWAQAGRDRGIRLWQTVAFKAGLVTLIIALLTPLDLMSDVLLSAHMVQHLLLLFAAAPLFTVSAAPLAFFWALSPTWRRKVAERWHRLSWL